MTTLLVLYLASLPQPSFAKPLTVGHCYSSDSDFDGRTIKILAVEKKEYRYLLFTNSKEWFGDLIGFKESTEYGYPNEVGCPKEKL